MSATPESRGGPDLLVYDGACALCRAAAARLVRRLPPGEVDPVSFRDPGVLARLPPPAADGCADALQLVRRDGRVFSGVEAIVEALRRHPLGPALAVLRWPIVRWVARVAYAAVARRRMRLSRLASGRPGASP
jgi:predicted DCC family thiol-disulfide oxidoreductase YuxK